MDLDAVDNEAKKSCVREVEAIFPDIDLKYLSGLADGHGYDSSAVVNQIMDQEQGGELYSRKTKPNRLKRKRDVEGDEGDEGNGWDVEEQMERAQRLYNDNLARRGYMPETQVVLIRKMLAGDFPAVPSKTIQTLMSQHGPGLLPTYLALDKAIHSGEELTWTAKKRLSEKDAAYSPENIDETIQRAVDQALKDLLQELKTARRIGESRRQKREAEEARRDLERMQDELEKKNFEEAEASGQMAECQCCMDDFPLNRMVGCNGDITHWFCKDCTRRQAETLVGLSKHELTCMSTDDCSAGFSLSERRKFLSKKLMGALERIEQEDSLRLAGLENLVMCPFCPFAAECPPIEVDKEFRCFNPDCEIVSCRLCKAETHIPISCEENAKGNSLSLRRQIEEAMSDAMIRHCNKCKTPFIKESGCNKMVCTRFTCRNMQCYVCSKSCDYSHFNDPNRGGKAGNCPLFDNVEVRHKDEVKKAEEEARKLVALEHPDLDMGLLEFNVSDRVRADDKRRQKGAGEHQPRIQVDEVLRRAEQHFVDAPFPNAPVRRERIRQMRAAQELADDAAQQYGIAPNGVPPDIHNAAVIEENERLGMLIEEERMREAQRQREMIQQREQDRMKRILNVPLDVADFGVADQAQGQGQHESVAAGGNGNVEQPGGGWPRFGFGYVPGAQGPPPQGGPAPIPDPARGNRLWPRPVIPDHLQYGLPDMAEFQWDMLPFGVIMNQPQGHPYQHMNPVPAGLPPMVFPPPGQLQQQQLQPQQQQNVQQSVQQP